MEPYQDFAHIGPGTLAGKFLRGFWQPVMVSEDLEPMRPQRIMVIGEYFTAYRSEDGTPHMVQDACAHRQTRLSLNDKRDRVRRLLLTNDPARIEELAQRYAEAHHDLVVAGSDDSLAELLHRGERGIVLLDPLGNVLMSYQPKAGEAGVQADFKGIRKDLKKLLKLSNIG